MLQVFSDFDFTISRLWLDDGSRGPSSHGVIEAALPGQFNVIAKEIFDTYYPIEIDPSLTIEQKVKLDCLNDDVVKSSLRFIQRSNRLTFAGAGKLKLF